MLYSTCETTVVLCLRIPFFFCRLHAVAASPIPTCSLTRPRPFFFFSTFSHYVRVVLFLVVPQDVYVTHTHLHMAMDLMEGGNLAVRYVYEGEEKAAHIVRQVVRALRYLHDRNIAVSLMIVSTHVRTCHRHFVCAQQHPKLCIACRLKPVCAVEVKHRNCSRGFQNTYMSLKT